MNGRDPTATLLRRSQIAAALRLVDHEVALVDPFLSLFERALATGLTLGSEGGWRSVWITTRSDRDGVLPWLHDVETRTPAASRALGALLGIGASAFEVSVGAVRHEDRLALGAAARLDVTTGDALGLATALGANAAGGALLEGARTLLADRLVGLAIRQEHPDGALAYQARFRWRLAHDQHAVYGERIVRMSESLGIGAAHGRFSADMLAALAPRAVNEIEVGLAFDAGGLLGRLSISYPVVPARLALRLLALLTPDPLDGRRLGVLAAASGVSEDVVSTLWIEVCAGAPPRVGFEFASKGSSP